MIGQYGGGAEHQQQQQPAGVDFGSEISVAKGQDRQLDQSIAARRKAVVRLTINQVAVGAAGMVRENQQVVPEG